MIDVCMYSTPTMEFQIDRNGVGAAVSLTVRSIRPDYQMETVRIFMEPQQMRDMRDVLNHAINNPVVSPAIDPMETAKKDGRTEVVALMYRAAGGVV